jgi:hypothetical protein
VKIKTPLWFLVVYLFVFMGCASTSPKNKEERLQDSRTDYVLRKILDWQAREREDAYQTVSAPGVFWYEYRSLQDETRDVVSTPLLVVRMNDLLYEISKNHYSPEKEEYWPTTKEFFSRGIEKEDCDGLELLSFVLMRERGFTVYRGIFQFRGTNLSHMVSVVFVEEEYSNPYIIDATGDLGRDVRRLSDIDRTIFKPLYLFNEYRVYSFVE